MVLQHIANAIANECETHVDVADLEVYELPHEYSSPYAVRWYEEDMDAPEYFLVSRDTFKVEGAEFAAWPPRAGNVPVLRVRKTVQPACVAQTKMGAARQH